MLEEQLDLFGECRLELRDLALLAAQPLTGLVERRLRALMLHLRVISVRVGDKVLSNYRGCWALEDLT